jgi:hypothetical protein
MDSPGYIYCFTNIYLPGLCKVGRTERHPIERCKEANSDTWSPPVWKCEFAKHVADCKGKELAVHRVLEAMGEHISRREMFKVSVEKVRMVFDLLESDYVSIEKEEEKKEISRTEACIQHSVESSQHILTNAGCRNQKKCFTDGQTIRHSIGENCWQATYRKKSNILEHDSKEYKSLTEFVSKHYESVGHIPESLKAWNVCECFLNGKWVSTFNIPSR